MNVMADVAEGMPGLNQQRLVAPLERAADQASKAIVAPDPRSLQPFHPGTQVRLREFHRQVKLVAHDHRRTRPPVKALRCLIQRALERLDRSLPREKAPSIVATIDHVVTRTGAFNPQRSGHAALAPRPLRLVKNQDLTCLRLLQFGIVNRMSGSFDAASGAIQLGGTGLGKFDASGVLRLPLFLSSSAYRVTLQLGDDALTGRLENQGWSFNFALAASGPTIVDADLPTTPGAYALVDGQWQPLPRNNEHTVYAAAQMLSGVLSALHNLDSRIPTGQKDDSEQSATLVFDGNLAAPSVSRDAVVIAYVGDIVPPSPSLRQKYPELRDYPPMEMARTQLTRDGKRQAALLKIVPGFNGFGTSRIAAALEQPKASTTLLRSTGALEPGMYAVACGSAMFEVQVR